MVSPGWADRRASGDALEGVRITEAGGVSFSFSAEYSSGHAREGFTGYGEITTSDPQSSQIAEKSLCSQLPEQRGFFIHRVCFLGEDCLNTKIN